MDVRFIGGPIDDTVRAFIGDVPKVIHLYDAGAPHGWVIVSVEQPIDPPWPGQVTYERDDESGNFYWVDDTPPSPTRWRGL